MNKKWGCTAVLVFVGIGFLAGAYLQYRPALPRKYRPLFEAAKAGNAKQVEELLRTGLDPNFSERHPWLNSPPGDWGMSPLHYAALTGEPETVAVLLKYGADPNNRAGYAGGDAPLDFVAYGDVSAAAHKGVAPAGFARAAEILVDAGAAPNYMSSRGSKAMADAVEAGDRALVEQLLRLDYGESRRYVFLNGLEAAAQWQREDMFEVFADLADTEALSLALQRAAHQGDVARMAKLLEQGAEPNFVSDAGTTPLYVAAREGHLDAVRLLLQHGARTDLANPHSQYRYPVDVARDPAIKQLLADRLTASPSPGMDADPGAPEAGTSTTR